MRLPTSPPLVAPVLSISRTLPPPSPSAPPIGIAQLPSRGVVQTLRPAGRDVFRAGRFAYAPGHGRFSGGGYGTIASGFYGSGYSSDADANDASEASLAAEASSPDVGFLRLDVSPGSAQVYVDGLYVSTVDDFNGAGAARALEGGRHRVEIRADGYETATFDVRIDPNGTTTYRHQLRADQPVQARTVVPAAPKTFYVIPKCYAGDKPPDKDRLPKGCLISNLRKVPPVVNKAG